MVSKKIYVGNLNYATTDESLSAAFSKFGEVLSAVVIMDRTSGLSKGFGFVEMADEAAADEAISVMNGKDLDGRRLRVNVAEDRRREAHPRSGNSYQNRPRGGYDRGNRKFDDAY